MTSHAKMATLLGGVGQPTQRNCIWDEGDGLFLSKCPNRCFGCAAFCWCRSMHMGCRFVWPVTEEDNPVVFGELQESSWCVELSSCFL